jgi:outer membrane protein assembly factor BamD
LAPGSGTGVGAEVVSAPPVSTPAVDPNAVVKPVGPTNTVLPAAEKPAEAPTQVNEVTKPIEAPATTAADPKKKKPKADLSDESSSSKKKKKGLAKLNPF